MVGEVRPLFEAIAQAETLDNLVTEATTTEIGKTHGTSHLVVIEQVGKIFLGKLADMEEGIAFRLLFLLLLCLLLLVYFYMILFGQPTQCLRVGKMFVFFQEGHHIASFTAAEALEDALRR